MADKENHILRIVMAVILLASMFFVAREGAVYVHSTQVENEPREEKLCVVIDAGHGGSK